MGLLGLAACNGGGASGTFPANVYPPALRPTPGVNISSSTGGCPNLDFVSGDELTVDGALEVLNAFVSGDVDGRRQVSDTAFWLLLSDVGVANEPLSADRIEVAAAADGPHAELIANACGEETMQLSWWVKVCPGPCDVTSSASLFSHWYLIKREGRWLVWAAE